MEHLSSDDTPFPVLEMRLVNMRGNVSEGAIINASVKCVATSLRLVNASGQTTAESEPFSDGGDRNSGNEGNVQVGNDSLQLRIKRKYEEMKISPAKHPFFSHGALYCRHELDADSPLLKSKIRKRIRDSGYRWPSDLNDPAKIRDCLSKDVYDIVSLPKHTVQYGRACVVHACSHVRTNSNAPERHMQRHLELDGRFSLQNALLQTKRYLYWVDVCKAGIYL
jgi:hypothetical protein